MRNSYNAPPPPPHAEQFVKHFLAAGLGGTDLHDENFMLRHDGSLVCTDPISDTSGSWGGRVTRPTKISLSAPLNETHA